MKQIDKKKLTAALVALLFIGIAIAAFLVSHGPLDGTADGNDRGDPGEQTSSDGKSKGDAASGSTPAPLTITPGPGEIAAPKRTAAAKPRTSPTPAPAAPSVTPEDPAYQQYLAETRAVVVDNWATLIPTSNAILEALAASDRISLTSRLAPGEGTQTTYLTALATQYPAIQTSAPLPTVNIYSVGGVTVYYSYQLVTWEDAGILSQHTIPIALRFVSGQWSLTTLGETGSDLEFVQSVTL